MASPDLEIHLKARDDGFGSAVRRAKAEVSELKGASDSVIASLSGGLIGGGIAGTVLAVVEKIVGLVRETSNLIDKAKSLGLSPSEALGSATASRFAGRSADATIAAMEAAQQAKADVEGGEPRAKLAFENIGLDFGKVAATEFSEIFFRALDQYKGKTITPGLQFAAERIFGPGASAVLPFAVKSGSQTFRGDSFESSPLGYWTGLLLGGTFSKIATIINGGNPQTAALDPVSTFPYERGRQAGNLAEQTRIRQIELARSRLPVEQQLNDIIAERLELQRKIEELADGTLEKEQLRSRVQDLREKENGINSKGISGVRFAENQSSPIQRTLSDLYRAGIFTGGAPLALDMQRQLLDEARRHTASLSNIEKEI